MEKFKSILKTALQQESSMISLIDGQYATLEKKQNTIKLEDFKILKKNWINELFHTLFPNQVEDILRGELIVSGLVLKDLGQAACIASIKDRISIWIFLPPNAVENCKKFWYKIQEEASNHESDQTNDAEIIKHARNQVSQNAEQTQATDINNEQDLYQDETEVLTENPTSKVALDEKSQDEQPNSQNKEEISDQSPEDEEIETQVTIGQNQQQDQQIEDTSYQHPDKEEIETQVSEDSENQQLDSFEIDFNMDDFEQDNSLDQESKASEENLLTTQVIEPYQSDHTQKTSMVVADKSKDQQDDSFEIDFSQSFLEQDNTQHNDENESIFLNGDENKNELNQDQQSDDSSKVITNEKELHTEENSNKDMPTLNQESNKKKQQLAFNKQQISSDGHTDSLEFQDEGNIDLAVIDMFNPGPKEKFNSTHYSDDEIDYLFDETQENAPMNESTDHTDNIKDELFNDDNTTKQGELIMNDPYKKSSEEITIDFGIDIPGSVAKGTGQNAIDKILINMIKNRASDLHLTTGMPLIMRIDGSILRDNSSVLTPDVMRALLLPIIPNMRKKQFAETWDLDFAYEIENVGRFRVNMFRDNHGVGSVMRHIPDTVLTAEQLGLPPSITNLCNHSKGLVLVTGPTGSGKSTTLAAMIDLINQTRKEHILTIEDPIEFVHTQKECLVNQREVGKHTRSFSSALKAALREDPDIVLVGELRDLETTAIALETAETGHLVFGTLHTNTAVSTVDRIIDQFPHEKQKIIRNMLASSLKGVVAQTLCKKNGGGRCAAHEILVLNDAVSAMIREGKIHMIPNHMQTQQSVGNRLMAESLSRLVADDLIDYWEGWHKAIDKAEYEQCLRRKHFDIPSSK